MLTKSAWHQGQPINGRGFNRFIFFVLTAGFLVAHSVESKTGNDSYLNPIDDQTYKAQWKTYKTDDPIQDVRGITVLRGVRILSGAKVVEGDFQPAILNDLIKTAVSNITFAAGTPTSPFSLLIDIKVPSEGPAETQVGSRGKVTPEILRKVQAASRVLPEVRLDEAPLHFQLEFDIGSKPRPE